MGKLQKRLQAPIFFLLISMEHRQHECPTRATSLISLFRALVLLLRPWLPIVYCQGGKSDDSGVFVCLVELSLLISTSPCIFHLFLSRLLLELDICPRCRSASS